MPLWSLVSHALLYGVILSLIVFTFITVIVRLNPEIMLKDYPPDIQEKYGPMSDRTKRQKKPVSIVFLVVLFVIVF